MSKLASAALLISSGFATLQGVAACAAAESALPPVIQTIPKPLQGPVISNPDVLGVLDCTEERTNCSLNFARLIQARTPAAAASIRSGTNPFNLAVSRQILSTIQRDLEEIRARADATEGQLSPRFLTDEGSRVELVGVVNRMARQFVRDTALKLTPAQLDCGEISLIYRFAYSIRGGAQKSRLPVTMNLVFPALPSDTRHGTITCQQIAQRWLNGVGKDGSGDPATIAASLLDPKAGPLAFISGRDLLRLELNMQVYRKGASADESRFGTEAAYLIRVFKWDPRGFFLPSFLRDQIDRDKLLASSSDTAEVRSKKEALRKKLVAYLGDPKVIASLDAGTLEIPSDFGFLAFRAISMSPGGSHRSQNQPYWNATTSEQQVISDVDIQSILDKAARAKIPLSFIRSKADFRTRLNETSCTGCHQTRAIAGFHFPGADRKDTIAANAVYLPGSPHFYGDQPRRMEILQKIAAGRRLSEGELATSYSARPMNRFANALSATQLIGGWGGACLTGDGAGNTRRAWTCREDLGLECRQVFKSSNDPAIGTCVAKGETQIGDPLQQGVVRTKAFGRDCYYRVEPAPRKDEHDRWDTRIPASSLPQTPLADNSYYGAHQEFYKGVTAAANRDERRDQLTGGFPGGMLRLPECRSLPKEASCGLIGSSGFNKCIERLASDKNYTIDICFKHFTSYAGIRACDAANPCRDDYICVNPMGYRPDTADMLYDERANALMNEKYFHEITGRSYDVGEYGQQRPDKAWKKSDDQRGLCIPPYFVFQFRSDGHPAPAAQSIARETDDADVRQNISPEHLDCGSPDDAVRGGG